jgi:NCS2 family nucleobase:cation symporter-2
MSTRPVDEMLPPGKLAAFGLQHVLVMYAGAIAVPAIIGAALKLPAEQIAFLINADLFCCGIVTIIQSLGVWKIGVRMPVMMGLTFAAVPVITGMAGGANPITLPELYGAIIGAGVVCLALAPFISRMVHLFPPVVTGTVILIIGISLARIGIGWAAGGPVASAPGWGSTTNIGLALTVLLAILAFAKWGNGFVKNIAVLCGLVAGCLVAYFVVGNMNFSKVATANWFQIITPFNFGAPVFKLGSILTISVVMIIVLVETTGMLLAVGDMVGEKVDEKRLASGLSVDGIGTIIGGIFNTFPYVSYSQNVGLVGVTGIKSRYVTVAAGVILIIIGLIPKVGAVAAAIPNPVLGGAGLVMFGMIAATGIKILSNVDFNNRNNLFIVAISVTVGLIPLLFPGFFKATIEATNLMMGGNDFGKVVADIISKILGSASPSGTGISLATFTAILLNIYFHGAKKQAE